MMRLLNTESQPISLYKKGEFRLDLNQLKAGEYLQLRYDKDKDLIGIRKLELLSPGGFAKATTDIPVGECGRVIYQGRSWGAFCEGERPIFAGESLLVLAQDKLKLIVTPA